jgi:hypothetical protein
MAENSELTMILSDANALNLFSGLSFEGEITVDLGTFLVNLKLLRSPKSENLVITFHGALTQNSKPYPYFEAWGLSKKLDVNVLAIADPSLTCSTELKSCWYLGHEGGETQKILLKCIKLAAEALGLKRVVLLGGSEGVFSAL